MTEKEITRLKKLYKTILNGKLNMDLAEAIERKFPECNEELAKSYESKARGMYTAIQHMEEAFPEILGTNEWRAEMRDYCIDWWRGDYDYEEGEDDDELEVEDFISMLEKIPGVAKVIAVKPVFKAPEKEEEAKDD